jgi:glycosyltransferase involved in cell wall biosynthesis
MSAVAAPDRPSTLHITHGWGGGLTKWVDDFCRHDSSSHGFVLAADGSASVYGLRLVLRDGRSGRALETWSLTTPIAATAIAHPEHDAVLREAVALVGASRLHVSSLIGHALSVLATPLPTTITYHDYYPFCVGLNVFFERVCTSCTQTQLEDCLARNPNAHAFRGSSATYWHELRRSYFERLGRRDLLHVVPTPSVSAHLRRLDERFASIPFTVIPHGLPRAGVSCFGGATDDRRLRLVVLGELVPQKGLDVWRQIMARVRLFADVTFLAPGDAANEFASFSGVRIVRAYSAATLSDRLADVRPDLAVFAATVPETFSFTLSEAWAHGLPACAFALGSFQDRIRDGVDGVLVPPHPEQLLRGLLELDGARERLRQLHANVQLLPFRSTAAMIEDYRRLRPSVAGGLDETRHREPTA